MNREQHFENLQEILKNTKAKGDYATALRASDSILKSKGWMGYKNLEEIPLIEIPFAVLCKWRLEMMSTQDNPYAPNVIKHKNEHGQNDSTIAQDHLHMLA